MLFKLITIIGALIALGAFLIRSFGAGRGGAGAAARKRVTRRSIGGRGEAPAEMAQCPECGAYREVGTLCPCERAPLP